MGLFTPIYMKGGMDRKQLEKALAKVAAISDPDKLMDIALNAPVPAVGARAAEGLNDPGRLRRVALEAAALPVRSAAVKKLTDAEALVSLAASEPGLFDNCLWRLKELGDRRALAKLFIGYSVADETQSVNAIDRQYKRVAEELGKLKDQEIIGAVAKAASKAQLRVAAAGMLESPEALARIALEDREARVRQAAVANPRFADLGALAGIAGDVGLGLAPLRWSAALRLSELDPERAVEPLVALMKEVGSAGKDEGCPTAAVRFLEARYKSAVSAGERACIASLPNRKYGQDWKGPCWHEDASVHFDIPR